MEKIPLNRQFSPHKDKATENYLRFRTTHFDWPSLLGNRRVAILAEGGSGKTTEFEERKRILSGEGKFAFYATLQDVGNRGLKGALQDEAEFDAWLASDAPGYFFLDSVDEAKAGHVRLETALNQIAKGIGAAANRAHIILSSRAKPWHDQRGAELMAKMLRIPDKKEQLPPLSDDDLLRMARTRERAKEEKAPEEEPVIVTMEPLDRDRIRKYAVEKGVKDIDQFLDAIHATDLWPLVDRPLDLDWHADYWIKNSKLGTFAEMLDYSISKRLKEPNPAREDTDKIKPEDAKLWADRLGAALIFGKQGEIAVGKTPNLELPLLGEILSDVDPSLQGQLADRPLFDPASINQVRLHSDNEGKVRSYLAARWIKERLDDNCPKSAIFELLFAETYGMTFIRPAMESTAAWLSIWSEDVAQRVIDLNPSLLMTQGDPGSLSQSTRELVLDKVVGVMAKHGEKFGPFDHGTLRQFSTRQLEPKIQELWKKHKKLEPIRHLLLEMIWLGRLTGCADLAASAVYEKYTSYATEALATRAFLTTATEKNAAEYLKWLLKNFRKLHHWSVWDGVKRFFPAQMSVQNFLEIYDDVVKREGFNHYSIPEQIAPVFSKLLSRTDLEAIIRGCLDRLGTFPQMLEQLQQNSDKAYETYFPLISAAIERLMQIIDADDFSEVAAEAALFIGVVDRHGSRSSEASKVQSNFADSSTRRRGLFWKAFELMSRDSLFKEKGVETPSQMEHLGLRVFLNLSDVEWVLNDAERRTPENEKRLLLMGLIDIWERNQRPQELLDRIKQAGERLGLIEQINARLEWKERDPQYLAMELQQENHRKERAKKEEEIQKSWREFLARMKANPIVLRTPLDPTADKVDGNLYNLWTLLFNATETENHYTIDNTARVEVLFGKDLTAELRSALKKYWRKLSPKTTSEKKPESRNSTPYVDLMGLTGISLEAADDPNWASKLSHDEAILAARFGTLEINGFSKFFDSLATAHPEAVRNVIMKEFNFELDNAKDYQRQTILYDIGRPGLAAAKAIVQDLLDVVRSDKPIPHKTVRHLATNIEVGSPEQIAEFADLSVRRLNASSDVDEQAAWLAAAFNADAYKGADALEKKLQIGSNEQRKLFAERAFAGLFGYHPISSDFEIQDIPFDLLVRLIRLAFSEIAVDDDNIHSSGMYTPDERDHAEQARSSLFNRLVEMPGSPTFAALNDFARMKTPPIPKKRLLGLAERRAYLDSDHSKWPADACRKFEVERALVARTPRELQRSALGRLADIQHDLFNDRFAQGRNFKVCPDEDAVQAWVADRLRGASKGSYKIERDSLVADSKRPDFRVESTANTSSIPVEVKVAESWSLKQLEEALTVQLMGRYIRERDNRHGILLIAHQKRRNKGWDLNGRKIQFAEIIQHLRDLAHKEAAKSSEAPQVEIAVLDVSNVYKSNRRKPAKKKVNTYRTTKNSTRQRPPVANKRKLIKQKPRSLAKSIITKRK